LISFFAIIISDRQLTLLSPEDAACDVRYFALPNVKVVMA